MSRAPYRINGREKLISFGVYPDVPLKLARDRREAARQQLAAGIDPGEKRKAEKVAQSDTFEAIAREWLALQEPKLARATFAKAAAGRLVLKEIDRLAESRIDFAFETTLSGLTYVRRLQRWKQAGYRVEIVYLRLRSTQLALRRIAARVRQGGHDVPRSDVVRRFKRGWENFESVYRPLADSWAVYENSNRTPRLLERGP